MPKDSEYRGNKTHRTYVIYLKLTIVPKIVPMKMFRVITNTLLLPYGGTILLYAAACFLPMSTHSQEALGIVNSNYTGVNSMWINPANASNSKTTYSLNLLAGDFFYNSNYFYVHRKDYGLFRLFKINVTDPKYIYSYSYPEYNFTDTINYVDYYKNTNQKNLYFNGRIAGPSLLFKSGNHAVAFLTAFRNNFSGTDIPYNVANFAFRGLSFIPQQGTTYDEKKFDFTMLSWIEIGAGYSYTLYNDGENSVSAGIALKYLLGTAAAYGRIDNVNYSVPNSDTLVINKMNATVGFALPADYVTGQFNLNPLIKGKGIGGDIGVTYKRMKGGPTASSSMFVREDAMEDDYLFRAGISLVDVGMIKFNQNVEVHQFSDVTNRIWPGLVSLRASGIQQFFRTASYHLLGDSLASLTNQTYFRMWLPAALSVQFDYNIGSGFYANATYVQGIRLGTPAVRRETLLAVTPRYETPIWEVNLPLSIVDWKYPAIGLAFRVYNLVIGTEKLGTFFNLTDVRGVDLYFSLAINFNALTGKGNGSKSRSKGCESIQEYKRYQVH
jgi:hypothetical protein